MTSQPRERADLRADCSRCAGLCCVVPAFTRSSDFALDKPSGVACPHLADEGFGCTIHTVLRERGFPGCTVYDCFGAGQRVVQELFDGRDWRDPADGTGATGGSGGTGETEALRPAMFAAFEVVERLHELLWYLADAASRAAAAPVQEEVASLRDAVESAAAAPDAVDVVTFQLRADALLGEVSGLVRAGDHGTDLRRRDLAGRDLRAEDLVAADLRGALLLGADLRGVDLTDADLLGADLRGADVCGADLTTALYLTQFQVNAARGDDRTALPEWLRRPTHWARA